MANMDEPLIDYLQSYFKIAKDVLPAWQHQAIATRARAKAGGHAKAFSAKSQPGGASVHVPTPLGSDEDKDTPISVIKRVTKHIDEDTLLPDMPWNISNDLNIDAQGHYDVEQCSALMSKVLVLDEILEDVTSDIHEAHIIADALLDDEGNRVDVLKRLYDVAPGCAPGLDIDLGSGTYRSMGSIGLDLHPYDHGTLLCDLAMGIPFPDNSCMVVRCQHALDELQEQNPNLAQEIQRVLSTGGYFLHMGKDVFTPPDNMVLQTQNGTLKSIMPDAPVIQVYRKLAPVEKSATQKVVPILKSDKHQQLVYGVVLAPGEIDTQGDSLTPKSIEEAAHRYMSNVRRMKTEHDEDANIIPVESYIAPQDLAFNGIHGPQIVTKGSWVLGVHILDPEIWQGVLNGDFTGFSIGADALMTYA